MTCDQLPSTGLDANVGLLLLLAILCLLAGTTLMFLARRHRSGTAAVLVLLVLLGGGTALITVSTEASAQAATSGCSAAVSSDDRLSVTQTSTMLGLAPGVAPAAITGRLLNISDQSTYVTAVEVEITAITPLPGASPGVCTTSDYRLIDTRMPVGRTLRPGGSTPFAGASIGFSNTTNNQDACQGATVHLRYTANPS